MPVLRIDVCNMLLTLGHKIKYVRKDYNNPGCVVFVFENTVNQEIIDDCVKQIRQAKGLE